MIITLGIKNLSHVFNKHSISQETIQECIDNPDMVCKQGRNIKYYYKGAIMVILSRQNKNRDWFLETAYENTKGFIYGDILWQK